MPRLFLSAALLVCAFPLACGVTPDREYGELVGSGGTVDDEPDPRRGGAGVDDRSVAVGDTDEDDGLDDEPVIVSLPRLTCPESVCVVGGQGGIAEGPLEGRDVIREAFLSVAGFTDSETYQTHAAPAQAAYRGVVGEASRALANLNALLAEGGIASCDDMPRTGSMSLQSAPGVRLQFAEGRSAPPQGHNGSTELYEKEVSMRDASGATAHVELNCGLAQGHARLLLREGFDAYAQVELTWDDTDAKRPKLELMSSSKARSERVALHFEASGSRYLAWLARSRGTSGAREAGLRVYLRGDSVDQLATAFVHEIPEQTDLYLAQGSKAGNLLPQPGATYWCADFADPAPDQGEGEHCRGLDLVAPSAPVYDDHGSFSVQWVAAPRETGTGMLRALSSET